MAYLQTQGEKAHTLQGWDESPTTFKYYCNDTVPLNKSKYQTHNHLVYSCKYHVIFCPKYRRKTCVGKTAQTLKKLILEKQEQYKYNVIEMEIMPDHVHLLIDVNPKDNVFEIVNKIKGYASFGLSKEFPVFRKPLWSPSKFISSVGAVTLDVVKKYIEDQKR